MPTIKKKLNIQANRRMEKIAYEKFHTLISPTHFLRCAIKEEVTWQRGEGKKIGNRVSEGEVTRLDRP